MSTGAWQDWAQNSSYYAGGGGGAGWGGGAWQQYYSLKGSPKQTWNCKACNTVNKDGKKACSNCAARRSVLEQSPPEQAPPQPPHQDVMQDVAPLEPPTMRQKLQEELKTTEAALAAIPDSEVASFRAARAPLVARCDELKKQISGLNPLTVRVTNTEAALERAKARQTAAMAELAKAQTAVDESNAQIFSIEADLLQLRRAAAEELTKKAAPQDCITKLRGALGEVHADLCASQHVHQTDAQHIVSGMQELLDKLLLLAGDVSRKASMHGSVFSAPPVPDANNIMAQLGAAPAPTQPPQVANASGPTVQVANASGPTVHPPFPTTPESAGGA